MSSTWPAFDARTVYSAAAADYERASARYWRFLSDRAIEQLDLAPGERVLDAACGTGPATLAAASRVGPGGEVVGVDYAEGMLALARQRVATGGAGNVRLVAGDIRALDDLGQFDAVLCVLGIFFADDMAAAARSLWAAVRPGGRLAVATFGAEVWSPMLEAFLRIASQERPDVPQVLPWRRTESPDVLAGVLTRGGVRHPRLLTEVVEVPFHPGDWRKIVAGSGLRPLAADLGEARERVLAAAEDWARSASLATVRVSVQVAVAEKPPPPSRRG